MASGPQRSTTREPRSKKPTRGSLTFHGILVGFFWRERMSSPKLWGIITKTLAFNWIWVIITNNGGILIFELVVEATLFLALSQSLLQRLLAWWLNQPSWKIWVKMASSSPIFGVKIKKYLKPPPSSGFCYNPPYNSWVGCHPPKKKKKLYNQGPLFHCSNKLMIHQKMLFIIGRIAISIPKCFVWLCRYFRSKFEGGTWVHPQQLTCVDSRAAVIVTTRFIAISTGYVDLKKMYQCIYYVHVCIPLLISWKYFS